jgi:phospholipid-translocating ATPase
MLDSLFRVYDNLCLQHGVQKIETVGYTYMAASGIKACEIGISSHILRTEKTMRLVNLAYDMLK